MATWCYEYIQYVMYNVYTHSNQTRIKHGKKTQKKQHLFKTFFLSPGWRDLFEITSKIQPRNKYNDGEQVNSKRQKDKGNISSMVWIKPKKIWVPTALRNWTVNVSVHTHANIPWKYTQHGQFSSLGWLLDSVHSLRRWVIYVELWRLLFYTCWLFAVLCP